MTGPRYFPTPVQRLEQTAVSSREVMPSPSMYDELLTPLWWTAAGLVLTFHTTAVRGS